MIIYRIYDFEDAGYNAWHGSAIDIERWLDEQKDQIEGYDEENSWTDNLKLYGLNWEEIYRCGCQDE
jgi:hypothetical protein